MTAVSAVAERILQSLGTLGTPQEIDPEAGALVHHHWMLDGMFSPLR
jgi:hypothetical protein